MNGQLPPGSDVVVCMVSVDQPEYAGIAIRSILKHSWPHRIRWCLLDNGSRTGEVFGVFSTVGPTVLRRNNRNLGIAAAWNFVLGAALSLEPDLICLVNDDVRVGPRWLDGIIREAKSPELSYFIPNCQFTFEETFDYDVSNNLDLMASGKPKTAPGRAGWCFFFKPDTVRKFLPIPEELFLWYNDDYIHWKLQHKSGYRCKTVLDSCVLHYGSRTISALPWKEDRIKKDLEFYNSLETHERRNPDGSIFVDALGRTVIDP